MIPDQIRELVQRGALFVCDHSAGKDSQAMWVLLRHLVPADQLVLVHADLGEVEWPGNVEHIQRYSAGAPLVVAKPVRGLLQMVEDRFKRRPEVPCWPDKARRQCTSDLKRGPIEREIRRYLKANPRFNGLVVNCQGMRADESPDRKKLVAFKRGTPEQNAAGREWWEWLPIHHLTREEVFALIAEAGEEPHPIYAKGMTRLSCCFCIMASKGDLTTAARLNPSLYARYAEIERRTGYYLSMSRKPLEEITGVPAEQPLKAAA